jgi:ATP-dependent phosphofructokinase / diphosphate-dependent phosphofructokinase
MRVGVLSSGGDCPGINAVIRAAVLRGVITHDAGFVGFRRGWGGVLDDLTMPLDRRSVRGLSKLGGTVLGCSRVNPFGPDGSGPDRIRAVLARHELDALLVIGGEGTLSGARALADVGLPIVGVPKTIDNDIAATDYSFGFDTAVEIATEALDRLRTTAESHERCMVLEVMGREAGWIGLHAGMAGGAHVILLPEHPESIEAIAEWVRSVRNRGRAPSVVVAEGFRLESMPKPYAPHGSDAMERPRLGGIGELLAGMIEERTGIETRSVALGHVQRGGVPTANDRVLATRLGIGAIDVIADRQWGSMVALRGTHIVRASLSEATGALHRVPPDRYAEVAALFG